MSSGLERESLRLGGVVAKLILEPGNPHDFEDLEAFAESLRTADPELEVAVVRRSERGYGVTLLEVLNVWWDVVEAISNIGGAYAVFDLVVDYAKARWRKDREEHGDRARPRSVTLYGPDGRPIKSVRIQGPDGEPITEALPEPRDKPNTPG